ncbi:hypothetical protein KL86CLO1_11170 [uncultured Eubacteriales bacterium]|uniref:Uncharacterized protein n=1 Tax=uncultured Eubacteriales bacterium TaxID=172733 RepID=A0A212JIK0_9FIRM|nr:hypothetical protein KL86CLO1_11170 [uncultured Eubacteriales bacterium]
MIQRETTDLKSPRGRSTPRGVDRPLLFPAGSMGTGYDCPTSEERQKQNNREIFSGGQVYIFRRQDEKATGAFDIQGFRGFVIVDNEQISGGFSIFAKACMIRTTQEIQTNEEP